MKTEVQGSLPYAVAGEAVQEPLNFSIMIDEQDVLEMRCLRNTSELSLVQSMFVSFTCPSLSFSRISRLKIGQQRVSGSGKA